MSYLTIGLIILGIFLFVWFTVWINKRWVKKLIALKETRHVMSREEFIREMSIKGHEIEVIISVYDNTRKYLPKNQAISIHPDDDLLKDYDIDAEDLSEMIIAPCLRQFNLKYPSHSQQDMFDEKYGSDFTVERFIQFVEYFKNNMS